MSLIIKIILFTLMIHLIFDPMITSSTTLHWKRNTSKAVTISVIDATNDLAWNTALIAGAEEWNKGMKNIEFIISRKKADCEMGAGPYSVVVCMHRTDPPNRAETNWYVGNNEHLRYTTVYLDPERAPAHRQRLACHELGHVLGLQHRTNGTSCMVPKTDYRHPDAADYKAVTDAHAHLHLGG